MLAHDGNVPDTHETRAYDDTMRTALIVNETTLNLKDCVGRES